MQTPSPKFLQKRWTFFLASLVAKHQCDLGDRKDVSMGKPTWTIRLAIILLSASGAMSTLSQRIMAQTTETQCAPMSPVRNLVDTPIQVQSQSRAGAKAKTKMDRLHPRDRIKTTGCTRGCVKWTKRGQASHILFHRWSQRTLCWFSNIALTCPGNKIPAEAL